MTWRKRTIMEMARDCGINFHQAGWPELERFAEQVRAEEREACAKVCEDIGRAEEMQAIGNDYAEAIRARGQA